MSFHLFFSWHSEVLQMSTETNSSGDYVCKAQSIIDACKEPLIGLQYVTEFRQLPANDSSWYVCNLCEVKFTYKVIVGHVTSTKHRVNYMKEKFMNYHTMIYQFAKTNAEKSVLSAEYAACIEEEEGRQKVKIKSSEPTEGPSNVAKKRLGSQLDDLQKPSKTQKISIPEMHTKAMPGIACPPKLRSDHAPETNRPTSKRIHFVGGGSKPPVESLPQNAGGGNTVSDYCIQKQCSPHDPHRTDSPLQRIDPGALSSERGQTYVRPEAPSLMSINYVTPTPVNPSFKPSYDSAYCTKTVPLKSCLRSPSNSATISSCNASANVPLKSCLKSARNAPTTSPAVDLESVSVGSSSVRDEHKTVPIGSYSHHRKELAANDKKFSHELLPSHPTSNVRPFHPPVSSLSSKTLCPQPLTSNLRPFDPPVSSSSSKSLLPSPPISNLRPLIPPVSSLTSKVSATESTHSSLRVAELLDHRKPQEIAADFKKRLPSFNAGCLGSSSATSTVALDAKSRTQNIDDHLQRETHRKDFTSATSDHSPVCDGNADLPLNVVANSSVQRQNIDATNRNASGTPNAFTDGVASASSIIEAKDTVRSTGAMGEAGSMTSAISQALAKALVKYRLEKKQQNN